jgi:hypothetical protein
VWNVQLGFWNTEFFFLAFLILFFLMQEQETSEMQAGRTPVSLILVILTKQFHHPKCGTRVWLCFAWSFAMCARQTCVVHVPGPVCVCCIIVILGRFVEVNTARAWKRLVDLYLKITRTFASFKCDWKSYFVQKDKIATLLKFIFQGSCS